MDEHGTLQDQVEAHKAVIERLEAVNERQSEVIERLEAVARRQEERLARLEAAAPAGGPATDEGDGGSVGRGETTDRRQLLSKAATVAAGAVVGGTALALGPSSPAMAAAGTFDGNPAGVTPAPRSPATCRRAPAPTSSSTSSATTGSRPGDGQVPGASRP